MVGLTELKYIKWLNTIGQLLGPVANRLVMYSQFSRLSTARGFCTGLATVGPAKVKAFKSILFTEGSPEVKIKNTLFHLTLLGCSTQ